MRAVPLIEADRQQSPGQFESESSALRTTDSFPLFLPDNTMIVSPSLSLSLLRLSPAGKTAPLYFFLAAFTNGLVTMEIAAHEI